jgi:NAD(P)-dependent dehydrogenase (short-subunit alcohol dehydrogenase family)
MKMFEEKVVLVTGGTSGIGRATAIAFAVEGAHVVVAARREAEGAESVALIEKAGGKGLFVKTDVLREEEIEAMVARTVEHFGRLDIAFNNAGVLLGNGPITGTTGEMFDRTFDINVRGVTLSMNTKSPPW